MAKKNTKKAPKPSKTGFLPDLATLYPVSQVALDKFELTPHFRQVISPRTFDFLRGVNVRPEIFKALSEKGFTTQEAQLGWQLLQAANGTYMMEERPGVSQKQIAAEVELDQWDEPNFEIIDVSLSIMFPEQRDYLFEGLSPQQGPAAVNSIRQLLRRVEILESGSDPNREATRAEDKAAIKELETTQILTKATRKHLAALIEIVETPSEDDVKHVERYNKQQAYHEDALKRLGLWIKKWRTIAKRTITRRSDLISLGLAERRKKNDADTLHSETPNTENVESEVVVDPPTTP